MKQQPRYGYRRIRALLLEEGFRIGLKKMYRLWRQEGFRVPRKRKRRRGQGKSGKAQHREPATRPNEVWAWDFVHDVDERGRTIRWLVMTDENSNELLILEPRRRFPASEVKRALLEVIQDRGVIPERLRSDNGPEFTAAELKQALSDNGIEASLIKPGSPWQNGKAESLNSRLRDEFFEMEYFADLKDAAAKGAAFKSHYNHHRPHSALGYQKPAAYAAALAAPPVGATPLPPAQQAQQAH